MAKDEEVRALFFLDRKRHLLFISEMTIAKKPRTIAKIIATYVPVCGFGRHVTALKEEFDTFKVTFRCGQVQRRAPIKVTNTHVVSQKHVPVNKQTKVESMHSNNANNDWGYFRRIDSTWKKVHKKKYAFCLGLCFYYNFIF